MKKIGHGEVLTGKDISDLDNEIKEAEEKERKKEKKEQHLEQNNIAELSGSIRQASEVIANSLERYADQMARKMESDEYYMLLDKIEKYEEQLISANLLERAYSEIKVIQKPKVELSYEEALIMGCLYDSTTIEGIMYDMQNQGLSLFQIMKEDLVQRNLLVIVTKKMKAVIIQSANDLDKYLGYFNANFGDFSKEQKEKKIFSIQLSDSEIREFEHYGTCWVIRINGILDDEEILKIKNDSEAEFILRKLQEQKITKRTQLEVNIMQNFNVHTDVLALRMGIMKECDLKSKYPKFGALMAKYKKAGEESSEEAESLRENVIAMKNSLLLLEQKSYIYELIELFKNSNQKRDIETLKALYIELRSKVREYKAKGVMVCKG